MMEVLKYPKIPEFVHVINMGKELQLRRGTGSEEIHVLRGEIVDKVLKKLLPMLDGTKDIKSILEKFPNSYHEEILSMLIKLKEKCLLEDVAEVNPSIDRELERYRDQLNFFGYFNKNKHEYQMKIKNSSVMVFGLGPLGVELIRILAVSGVGHLIGVDPNIIEKEDIGLLYSKNVIGKFRCDVIKNFCDKLDSDILFEGQKIKITSKKDVDDILSTIKMCNILIMPLERLDPALLKWVNEICLNKKIKWINCSIVGSEGSIGPTIFPFETPCYTCYESRLESNVPNYEAYLQFKDYLVEKRPDSRYGAMYPSVCFVANFTAVEILKVLTNIAPPITYGNIITIDFLSMAIKKHPILKIPFCSDCGSIQKKRTIKVWMEE